MADFTFSCHRCVPGTPGFNNLTTQMEGMRKKFRIKSSTPERSWSIEFHMQSLVERDLILAHFNSQYGINGTPFYWTSLPSWIFAIETSLYVVYKSYKEEVVAADIFNITIEFDEVIIG